MRFFLRKNRRGKKRDSIDPEVFGGLFPVEKRGGGTQGTEIATAISPGQRIRLTPGFPEACFSKRNGVEEKTGGVLSGVEVGDVISLKKLKGLNRHADLGFKSQETIHHGSKVPKTTILIARYQYHKDHPSSSPPSSITR